MMGGVIRFMGMFAIIPAAILLTISFFVLVVVHIIDKRELKIFGRTIAVFLWVAAALVFSTGLYVVLTAAHPITCVMKEKIRSCVMSASQAGAVQKDVGKAMKMEMKRQRCIKSQQ